MAFFHLRALPGQSWPPVPDAAVSQVWAAYLELDRNQWRPADEIRTGQLAQVRTLLAHCIAQVPYYRRLLTQAGIVPGAVRTLSDFRRVPPLPREVYQEHLAEMTAERLPAGTVATGQSSTGGSSGRPVLVLQTNITGLWWHACYLRDLEWSGIDPTGSIASIRATGFTGENLERAFAGIRANCWRPDLDGLIETGPAYGMDVNQDPRLQLRWLASMAPDYLLSYPSNLLVLASLARETRTKLTNLRAIQTVSETLTEDVRRELEATFGVPVKNLYSCNEAGYIASPCPAGSGWHVHSENVLAEVIDERGEPCAAGGTGRLLLTAIHNFRAPFIRYEVGDTGTLGGVCACGRSLPLLTHIHGKSPAVFRLPDGRSKSSYGLNLALRKIGGFHQHQVIQRALDHITIRIVPAANWSGDHASNLQRCIEEFFERPARIDLEIKERLELPAGGKFQHMICEC